jgi:hypothetical protein
MAGSAVGPTLLTTGELEAEIGVLLRRIRHGQTTDLRTKRAIAVLGVPPKRKPWPVNDFGAQQHHGVWSMKFLDDPPRPLRIMSLAWLLSVWRMQRVVDNQE